VDLLLLVLQLTIWTLSQQTLSSTKFCILIVDTQGGDVMKTKVQKWGNSLALRIPKSFATETALTADSEVNLSLVEGKLIVTPIVQPEYSLEALLEGVTNDNIHAEVDTGLAVGNESW
jgi:antitoxin MazE